MSLTTSAAGNKRRRVDVEDSDSDDEDNDGYMKILNWDYSVYNYNGLLESLPRPTMKCEFPIMFSSHLDSTLSDPSYYFKVSLYHMNIADTISVSREVRTSDDAKQQKFDTVKALTLPYLYDEEKMTSYLKSDKQVQKRYSGEWFYSLKAKDYLDECARKTKQVVDYYSAPNQFPGTEKFAAVMVERCKRDTKIGETRFCTLQVLVPSRLAISASASEYAQKTWCVETFNKLKTALADFGIDGRDFVQGEQLTDSGEVELRF